MSRSDALVAWPYLAGCDRSCGHVPGHTRKRIVTGDRDRVFLNTRSRSQSHPTQTGHTGTVGSEASL
jgi:hypothetical protein